MVRGGGGGWGGGVACQPSKGLGHAGTSVLRILWLLTRGLAGHRVGPLGCRLSTMMVKSECEREESSFISVDPVVRHAEPASRQLSSCSRLVTASSRTPSTNMSPAPSSRIVIALEEVRGCSRSLTCAPPHHSLDHERATFSVRPIPPPGPEPPDNYEVWLCSGPARFSAQGVASSL